MLYINTTKNPLKTCSFYFGLEEHLIKDKHQDEDIFLLWNVLPTVMIGRHQLTTQEINESYVKQNDIEIVRRSSGGGAVYTDLGCFQFSIITSKTKTDNLFKRHLKKIVDAFQNLGIDATFSGRNDILLNGRKFSGTAEYIVKNKMVIHGTILFNSNLTHLVNSLNPDEQKLSSHAIKSVKSRVINISDVYKKPLETFYKEFVDQFKTSELDYQELDQSKINYYGDKYTKHEWNYGKNPKFTLIRKDKLPAGLIELKLKLQNKIIKDFKIHGDFFSLKKITPLENAFIDKVWTHRSMKKVLKDIQVDEYILNLSNNELLDLFNLKKNIRKPDYLKVDLKNLNKKTKQIKTLLKQHELHTVCQEANCPNQLECFSNGTATFMILGDTCTRNCRFCDVKFGRPKPVDKNEPKNIVYAVKLMKLKHVVVTSVDRDDLDDFGAGHFKDVINHLKEETPDVTIEVLIPDFRGDLDALKTVVDAKPDVINHNLETIPRLYQSITPQANYNDSLTLLKRVKELDPNILTKSGVMVGLGETKDEIISLMDDLRAVDCDILTIGQYLRPSSKHIEIDRYVDLEEFDDYKKIGKEKGFRFIASGPKVRSSYQAINQFEGE
ncbi:MAG: lipoyl synthase [Candidatus Izimaplasma sp.]|nr:lipoyl synthase [Candidatus Izimaplasma bacterium]